MLIKRLKSCFLCFLFSFFFLFYGKGQFLLYALQDWAVVDRPWSWVFPRDHGNHPEFQTEWWYFTGNLYGPQQEPFGFQWTLFRQGIFSSQPPRTTRWALRDIYFAHFALSDIPKKKFYAFEKADRGALKLAGTTIGDMGGWIRGWELKSFGSPKKRFHIYAQEEAVAIDLDLEPLKPPVLHGENGLSRKADQKGAASYYYSFSRLQTEGLIRISNKSWNVKGTSWFDHEFTTNSLGKNEVGWDWFAIQLDSGEELMLYCLRTKDGDFDHNSGGTWIGKEETRKLTLNDFIISRTAFWKSPHTGAIYPSGWKIKLLDPSIEIEIKPKMADQELVLNQLGFLAYWEGAVSVKGKKGENPVHGEGYVELTGYAAPLQDYLGYSFKKSESSLLK
ncbi:carotenoid 1,2-hydratase [Methylacidiphilum caldifontis]|uniref:lipocalin-like domain-containing protein n=1 Tax=Methylacidiphilum caldifontis TaxID=2795386 RepID=UPI001A8C608B|nr:lipocalin-like domain-containing protein [Methylacidiphilum caldifontis]QSR88011.1 carotenoid 1,2-hydratase [Methylacidiphilum caldifontis]